MSSTDSSTGSTSPSTPPTAPLSLPDTAGDAGTTEGTRTFEAATTASLPQAGTGTTQPLPRPVERGGSGTQSRDTGQTARQTTVKARGKETATGAADRETTATATTATSETTSERIREATGATAGAAPGATSADRPSSVTGTAGGPDIPGSTGTVPDPTGTVWSAGTAASRGPASADQPPRDIRGSTLLWGAVLLLVGGLLIATGLGVRLDPVTTAIVCLGGVGILLVVVALVPRRAGRG